MSDDATKKLANAMLTGMAPDLFEHEMHTNSKILGRESGITVLVGGSEAKTDGKTVVLPALDKGGIVTNHAANVARGFVNHEAAHLRFSNANTVRRLSKHERHAGFLNGMEDVRIEKTFSDAYPGAVAQFTEAANATLKRFFERVDAKEIVVDDRTKLVPMATAWKGRQMMGQAIDRDLMTRLETMVGSDLMPVVDELATTSLKATGTLDIARYLENWLGKVDPETQKEKDEHRDRGGAGGGAGGGGGEGGGDGAGGLGAAPHWQPGSASGFFDPSMADAVQAALPTGERRGAYLSRMDKDVIWDDFEQFMKSSSDGGALDRYREAPLKAPDVSVYPGNYMMRTIGIVPTDPAELRKFGLTRLSIMRDNLGPSVRAVKQALERGLTVAKQRNWDSGMTRGYIDPRRLSTVLTGGRNYKRVRSAMEMLDTAVMLVIDMSGSMNGEKATEAQRAAYVFAESLTKVGVPIEVVGFFSDRKHLSRGMSREGIIDIPVFKNFNEHMQQSMWKIALAAVATQTRGGGNNADGDSLLHAWHRLRKRTEPRKVMITFSDGAPATSGGGDEHGHLRRVVRLLTVQGCECYGIGIMSDAVRNYYPEYVVINNANELATKGGEFLKNLLIPSQKRMKAARKDLKAA